MKITEILTKADARISHAEDLVFFDGSRGAIRALDALAASATPGKDITLKWDGSPSLYFGRLPDGQFVLTDKSGFTAKGYNGLVTSAEELKNMFLQRSKEIDAARKQFASHMADLWLRFEKTVPIDFRGFIKGDLLYCTQPNIDSNNDYTFTPNIVTYHVAADSNIGKRISMSTAAIAVHSKTDGPGEVETPVDIDELNLNTEVMIVGPTYVEQTPIVNKEQIDSAKKFVMTYAKNIDAFLNQNTLAALKLSDVSNIFYAYINAMVKSGQLLNFAKNFAAWLSTAAVSSAKKQRLLQYIGENSVGFNAIFVAVELIEKTKNNIIHQLDAANVPIRASIAGKPGGEGYVVAHPAGPIKLVNRAGFSAANFAKVR